MSSWRGAAEVHAHMLGRVCCGLAGHAAAGREACHAGHTCRRLRPVQCAHLLGLQPLLLEAEALDFVEVLAYLVRLHVVDRVPGHGLVAAATRKRPAGAWARGRRGGSTRGVHAGPGASGCRRADTRARARAHLLLLAVKNASVLCPGLTRTYSCVGLNSQGMSSATSALNHTVTSRSAAALRAGRRSTSTVKTPRQAAAACQASP